MPKPFAFQVVNDCLRITERDNVTILTYKHSIPLAEKLAIECFKKGADALLNLYTDAYHLAYLKNIPIESLRKPSVFCRALTEHSTAEIWLSFAYDPRIFRKVSPDRLAADAESELKAHWPMTKKKKVRSIFVGLAGLTAPRARAYGLNFEKWKKATLAASSIEYGSLARLGRRLRKLLSRARTIHISAPNDTDLTLAVARRRWLISDGVVDRTDIKEENFSDNIPAGSISAIPVQGTGHGVIVFNTSMPYAGAPVKRLRWRFQRGRLTYFSGDDTIKPVKETWAEAGGDKDRMALFTIGFNPKAQLGFLTNNIVAGTVTLGIGGNEQVGGRNKSGFYFEHSLSGATVKGDGVTIVKDGQLNIRSPLLPKVPT
jgi:leucyl aminopeptidase (aminopeptidase T)